MILAPLQKVTIGEFYLTLIYSSGKDGLYIEEKINKGRYLPHERFLLITT